MAETLWHAIEGLPDWVVVMILSAAPISEARYAVPVGICVYEMPLWTLLPLAIISNVVAVSWVVPTFHWMEVTFDRTPILGPLLRWLRRRAEKRGPLVEKYGMFAVTMFIAVPLPITGAWTGSVVAAVFRMPFAKAMVCLVLGVLIATGITTSLTLAGISISSFHVPR